MDTAQAQDGQHRLRDGRLLGYTEYGRPDGKPVFYFHGFPSSRLEARLADGAAARTGVRLIAVDRPGFGLSDFKRGRTLGDWPDDVIELADALWLERFAVLGVSGGGPYAAACAWKIPQRVSAAGIVCGLGPVDSPRAVQGLSRALRLGFFLLRRARVLVGPFCRIATWAVRRHTQGFYARVAATVAAPDQAVLARPEVQETLVQSFREAVYHGAAACARELRLYSRHWGFELRDVSARVYLWHGEHDRIVPCAVGRYVAQSIPGCHARFYPDDGHYSLPVERMEEILAELLTSR